MRNVHSGLRLISLLPPTGECLPTATTLLSQLTGTHHIQCTARERMQREDCTRWQGRMHAGMLLYAALILLVFVIIVSGPISSLPVAFMVRWPIGERTPQPPPF